MVNQRVPRKRLCIRDSFFYMITSYNSVLQSSVTCVWLHSVRMFTVVPIRWFSTKSELTECSAGYRSDTGTAKKHWEYFYSAVSPKCIGGLGMKSKLFFRDGADGSFRKNLRRNGGLCLFWSFHVSTGNCGILNPGMVHADDCVQHPVCYLGDILVVCFLWIQCLCLKIPLPTCICIKSLKCKNKLSTAGAPATTWPRYTRSLLYVVYINSKMMEIVRKTKIDSKIGFSGFFRNLQGGWCRKKNSMKLHVFWWKLLTAIKGK